MMETVVVGLYMKDFGKSKYGDRRGSCLERLDARVWRQEGCPVGTREHFV